MHIAYTGPRILNVDDEGYPLQPYGIRENPYSILDVADIVFVDPLNTGYSRMIEPEENESENKTSDENKQARFFGVNADVKYLAEWLNTFVVRNNRWLSPKYLNGPEFISERHDSIRLF